MFSGTPFDSFYENPSSNTCFLMNNFPNSLLNDDEELLFDHLFHPQSPSYDSINNPNSSQNPNNHPQKKEELGHDEFTTSTKASAPPESGGKRKRVAGKQTAGAGGRRRTGKKDRHSKIYTAQGPRDRRMRLSLQIARKFFDLQDMLGFDKASKTIEWLFSKSKPAIRELTSSLPPHQRKCSLVISTTTTTNKVNGLGEPKINAKPGCSNPVARASREKARARARERTIEKKKQKMMLDINPNHNNNNDDNSVTMFDEEELSSKAIENRVSGSVSIIEKLLGSDSSASSSSIYDECSHLGFTGNWVSESLRMYPSYGAISGVDELQVILQQQNPNSVSSQASSGMQFQSP